MRLMATFFILIFTATPTFAASILAEIFASAAAEENTAQLQRDLGNKADADITALIDAINTLCLKAYPENPDAARHCENDMLVKIWESQDNAKKQLQDQERQREDAREQQEQLLEQDYAAYKKDRAQEKERQLRAQRELYRLMDQAIQKEHEIHRQQRDADIDAARNQQDTQLEAARIQAAGMILQGFALRGGPLGSFQMPAPYVPYTPPAFIPAPAPRSLPPISCSTNVVGGYAQTDCY